MDHAQHKDVNPIEGIGEALHSAAYSFAQTPIDGIAQAFGKKGPQIFSKPENDDIWTQAGAIAGSVGQFVVAAKVLHEGMRGVGFKPAGAPLSLWESATAGAAVDLLHPVEDPNANYPWEKLRSAAVAFGTFAAMGKINQRFSDSGFFGRAGRRSLAESITVNAAAGFGGGVVNAELDAWSHGRWHASDGELFSRANSYAAFGAMFGAGERVLFKTNPSLRVPKSMEERIAKAPSTEEFVVRMYDGKQPLQSDILSWLADTRKDLRPPNYAEWKQTWKDNPSAGRELDLMDWRPERRLQVVQALRELADTGLAQDRNIDAFLTRVNGRKEVGAYRGQSWGPERRAAYDDWANASRDLQRLVESDTTLWERRWTDILTDSKLHEQRPEVKQLADRIITGEKKYMELAQAEVTASGVQDGLRQELNSISRELGLPKLNRGFDIEPNETGGSYYHNKMMLGDRRVASGPGRMGEASIHEMRHHEQGRQIVREFLIGPEPDSGASAAYSLRRGQVELQLLNREGGTYDFLQRLSNPNNVSHAVFYGRGGSTVPSEIRTFSRMVRDGEVNVERWDEAYVNKAVREFLENHNSAMRQAMRREHFDYVGSRVEIPAWSLGFLGRIRAQALGLSDVPAAELPYAISAKDLLKKD